MAHRALQCASIFDPTVNFVLGTTYPKRSPIQRLGDMHVFSKLVRFRRYTNTSSIINRIQIKSPSKTHTTYATHTRYNSNPKQSVTLAKSTINNPKLSRKHNETMTEKHGILHKSKRFIFLENKANNLKRY